MTTILLTIVIFLDIIFYIIFFDIILSWLALAGMRFRPSFVARIVDPIYGFVRKYIPTRFWMFDFTPLIVIFAIMFFTNLIVSNSPEITTYLQQFQWR